MRGLTAWTLLLWGPSLWFLHFGLVYGIASLALTYRPAAGVPSRVAIAAATAAMLALVLVGWLRAGRYSPGDPGSDLHRFWRSATALLCLISAIAIVYQALPAVLVP